MADSAKAVFLSYASQDAEAAKRICEALRAAGVEVWFDQNELVGGDAWDAKIRQQIGSCALFVPVISANTQARREGYFRIEWRLATQRTHGMADGTPFLLPVTVDDTNDRDALVPEAFRAVQWTRLRLWGHDGQADQGGEAALAKFVARVKGLLSLQVDAESSRLVDGGERATSVESSPSGWRRLAAGIAITGCVVAGLALILHRRSEAGSPVPSAGAETRATGARESAGPLTPAQRLIAQARTLYEPWRVATADDLQLADRLLREATELEPANAHGWAALAILSTAQYQFALERTEARLGLIRSAADRAARLAPDSPDTQLALAFRYRTDPVTRDDGERVLRALAARSDAGAFIQRATLRELASSLRERNQTRDALATLERATALPNGDPSALFDIGSIFLQEGRFEEAVAVDDRAIALRPDFGAVYAGKLVILLFGLGDLARTRNALQRIPERVLRDERVTTLATLIWFLAGEHEKAAELLRLLPGDYLESEWTHEPKALLAGMIHERAGRKDAAAAEWRLGLHAVEQRLATDSTNLTQLGNKAKLLALLGERAAAEDTLRLVEQLARLPAGRAADQTVDVYAALGRATEVADFWEERLKAESQRPASFNWDLGSFRFDPLLDPFRSLPRFQALAHLVNDLFAKTANHPGGTAADVPPRDQPKAEPAAPKT